MIKPGRYASIDIGTNSTLLLIADIGADGTITPVEQRQTATRLGEGLAKDGRIGDAGLERTAAVLDDYKQAVGNHSLANPVQVTGTAVFRWADNGAETARKLAERTGMKVQIISGQEEARLSYLAAHTGLTMDAPQTLLVDCGGGSTELVAGNGETVTDAVSVPVGAVVLTEQHLQPDPPGPESWKAFGKALDAEMAKHTLPAVDPGRSVLIGVAGTVTTLAAIHMGLPMYDAGLVHGHILHAETISGMLDLLNGLPLMERKNVPGLPPERADIILAGTAIILSVMRRYGFDSITVSDRGLRFGLVLQAAM